MDAWATKQQADHNRASFRRMDRKWPTPRRPRYVPTTKELEIAIASLDRQEALKGQEAGRKS